MKKIKIRKDIYTLVDDSDYKLLVNYKWYLSNGYAVLSRFKDGLGKYMHRSILQPPSGLVVDHINGNKLDNRRKNLRIVCRTENQHNSILPKSNNTGYRGVHKHYNKWQSVFSFKKVRHHLGTFNTKEEAAMAYNKIAIKWLGKYARINKIEFAEKLFI